MIYTLVIPLQINDKVFDVFVLLLSMIYIDLLLTLILKNLNLYIISVIHDHRDERTHTCSTLTSFCH
jgi:hypothetical protein